MKYFNSEHDISGVYLRVSEEVIDFIGYSPKELIGTNAYEYFHIEDITRIIGSHIKSEYDKQEVVYRIRNKNDIFIWVSTISYRKGDIIYTKTKKLNILQIFKIIFEIKIKNFLSTFKLTFKNKSNDK